MQTAVPYRLAHVYSTAGVGMSVANGSPRPGDVVLASGIGSWLSTIEPHPSTIARCGRRSCPAISHRDSSGDRCSNECLLKVGLRPAPSCSSAAAMPSRKSFSFQWLHMHLLSLDWQTRHDYLQTVLDSVSHKHRELIQKNVVAKMSPSDLLHGTCTGKMLPGPRFMIIAADFPRTPKKRQLKLTDVFAEQRRKLSKH